MRLPVRQARNTPAYWNLVKTLIQTIFFWFIFLAVIPIAIQQLETFIGWPSFGFPFRKTWGWCLFAVSSCLGLWSGATMSVAGSGTPLPLDTARKLVVSGPYRYVRNPMAVAGLAQGACVGIILGSFGTLIYVLAGMIVWNYFVRPAEEADLALRFGEAYADYCKKTKCWIPNFPGYRLKKDN